jgi:hypothetical protein
LGPEKGNYWIAYRGAILKCAPHQLRKATNPEKLAMTKIPENLREAARKMEGSRRGFLDLTEEDDPPEGMPASSSSGGAEPEEKKRPRADGEPHRRVRKKTPFGAAVKLPATLVTVLWATVQSAAAETLPSWAPKEVANSNVRDYLQEWQWTEQLADANIPKKLTQMACEWEERAEEAQIFLAQSAEEYDNAEVYIAAPVKRGGKEIYEKHMTATDKMRFQHAKQTEWETLVNEKHALRVLSAEEEAQLCMQHPEIMKRILPSRFVLTDKAEEDGMRAKARFCLGGHCDPDLEELVNTGALASPTCSTLARYWCLQLIASFKFRLELGDIKCAFLEAQPLDRKA